MENTAAKPSGGRPKLDNAARRSSPISIRLTFDERVRLEGAAAQAGLSLGEFMRRASLGHRMKSQPAEAASMAAVGQLRRLGNNLNQILKEARFQNFPPSVAVQADECLSQITRHLRRLFHHDP